MSENEKKDAPGCFRKEEVSESKTSCDFSSLLDLSCQVQMISDSLAACKQIGKYRPLKKDFAIKTNLRHRLCRQTPIQILLPPEERTLEYVPNPTDKTLVVSYMMKEKPNLRYLKKSRTFSIEEGVSSSESDERSIWSTDYCCQNFGKLTFEANHLRDMGKDTSEVQIYKTEEVDPSKLIHVIERELRTLMKMAPSVALIVSEVADTIFHYKECHTCNEKIRPALPWILNKIQNLIKFVTLRKGDFYIWPNDYFYLKLSPRKSEKQELGKETQKLNSYSKNVLDRKPDTPKKQIGKLEKVDVLALFDDKPGLQLLLELKPKEKENRRLFCRRSVSRKHIKDLTEGKTFSVIEPVEGSYNFLVEVLRSRPRPRLFRKRKHAIVNTRVYYHAVGFVSINPEYQVLSGLVLTPVSPVLRFQTARSELYLKSSGFYEEQHQQSITNPVTVALHKIGYFGRREEVEESRVVESGTDESETFTSEEPEDDVHVLIRQFLKEAEFEKAMDAQKVKGIEEEVRCLKEVMMEVHKNQLELSKMLLQKGVFSKSMIKLTDPNMLQEESQMIKRTAEIGLTGQRTCSLESLKTTIDELKRKCTIKYKMIVTLLTCLQSNIPKDWWEELFDYVFDESKPIEEFDAEKVSNFIRQTSIFLLNGDKASTATTSLAPKEDLPSAEESNSRKGKMGAEIEKGPEIPSSIEGIDAKAKDSLTLGTDFGSVLGTRDPIRYWAFPVSNMTAIEENIKNVLEKLEYQIALLNAENDRLWHQVNELRDLVKISMTESLEKTQKEQESSRSSSTIIKPSKKTINLTIQICDKDLGSSKGSQYTKIFRNGDNSKKYLVNPTVSPSNSFDHGTPKSFSGTKSTILESQTSLYEKMIAQKFPEVERTQHQLAAYESDRKFSLELVSGGRDPKFPSKSDDRSGKDLENLDDVIPKMGEFIRVSTKEENEKLRALLQSRLYEKEVPFVHVPKTAVHQVKTATPDPSQHDIYEPVDGFSNNNPVTCLHSKYLLREVSDMDTAGPSTEPYKKRVEVGYLLQKPSMMELARPPHAGIFAMMANERELQTIPENEHNDSSPSFSSCESVNKAIQKLRAKVRLMHQDMVALKSKNDWFEKMLDNLAEDTEEHIQNFEGLKRNPKDPKARLG